MSTEIKTIPDLNVRFYTDPDFGDFINITELAQSQGDKALIEDWLKNKNTIEFLGTWEKLNNPNFFEQAYRVILSDAGTNRFRLSVRKWTTETGAVGIRAKYGKYGGGTFAHIDIALEFAGWLRPDFRLYVIKEFQRYKKLEAEANEYQIDWNVHRMLTKSAYRVHTDAVQEILISEGVESDSAGHIYATEADIFNIAVFGQTAAEWKRSNPTSKGNLRDNASLEQLIVLSMLESQNALLIKQGKSLRERKEYLIKTSEELLKKLMTERRDREQELLRLKH